MIPDKEGVSIIKIALDGLQMLVGMLHEDYYTFQWAVCWSLVYTVENSVLLVLCNTMSETVERNSEYDSNEMLKLQLIFDVSMRALQCVFIKMDV